MQAQSSGWRCTDRPLIRSSSGWPTLVRSWRSCGKTFEQPKAQTAKEAAGWTTEREKSVSTSSARRPRTSTSATPTAPIAKGRVIFVGTGPGDPDLLTLGAIAALADASSVILDNDRQREILAHPAITLADSAEVITLGLTEARKPLSPSARAKIVLKQASTGTRVVRLVSGDPFLDNAVADEAAACVRGGIDFEVVPGVSSLTAVPEYAGIDLIHAGGVQFASVTDGKFSKNGTAQWGAASTIVVSTVVSMIGGLVEAAKGAGRPGDDHVVVTLHAAALNRSP